MQQQYLAKLPKTNLIIKNTSLHTLYNRLTKNTTRPVRCSKFSYYTHHHKLGTIFYSYL